MRTHRTKSAHLTAEYIPPTFWLVPPPPFPQVDGGGCYREKFFLILFFLILARYLVNGFLRLNNFFIFFWIHNQLVLIILRFWFYFFCFSYSIPTRILFFYFFKTLLQLVKFSLGIPYQLLSFLVLYSFDYDFEFTSYRWELWLRYNFSISYFRFWISTCFSIVYSTLYLLNSLSL